MYGSISDQWQWDERTPSSARAPQHAAKRRLKGEAAKPTGPRKRMPRRRNLLKGKTAVEKPCLTPFGIGPAEVFLLLTFETCSYLLPGIRRRRSAPASLCRVMAQAAWPSGAASLMHGQCQRPTTFAPPLSQPMLPPPGASHNLPTRPVSVSGAGPPRFATHRPAPLPLTSHAHRF
jgi:hypothetical protein